MATSNVNYWFFNNNTKEFDLTAALEANELRSIQIASKAKIQPGDKFLIWQKAKVKACYAIGTILSKASKQKPEKEELSFFKEKPKVANRAKIQVDINLWNAPLSIEEFDQKTNVTAPLKSRAATVEVTEDQYQEVIETLAKNRQMLPPNRPIGYPLNMILHGPPGTGKTYHTVNYTLGILENKTLSELAKETRESLRHRFEEYMEEGMVHMVSFHKNYKYEDFIESAESSVRPETGEMAAHEDGIFKYICLEAKRSMVETMVSKMNIQEIKIDFNALYKAFLQHIQSADFKYFISKRGIKSYLHKIARGTNILVRPEKSFSVYTLTKARVKKIYKHFAHPDQIENIENEIASVLGGQNAALYFAVLMELKRFEYQYLGKLAEEKQELDVDDDEISAYQLELSQKVLTESKKFVIIIDEINRGDIAAIFGELISLIEENRREGGVEMTTIVLPYSKTLFSVPPNVYIIGTMDSSAGFEQIDSALRRRFKFIEMEPQASIIRQQGFSPIVEGIDLAALMNTINQRINLLLGANKRIGHTYFLEIMSINDLKSAFAYEIIPLLKDYFNGDMNKLALVLGESFFTSIDLECDKLFPNGELCKQILDAQFFFKLKDMTDITREDFLSIYE